MGKDSSAPEVLRVRNAAMRYGTHTVVEGLNLSARAGHIVAITGPNGAGKSTLLRGLAGFQQITFDSFQVDGEKCPPNSTLHRSATYAILGDWMWIRDQTVRDHLQLLAPTRIDDAAMEAMETFGIADLADRMPYSLSSGQLQRASLCSILLRPWRVLFLDEPEQRLDREHLENLSAVLGDIVADRAILLATHSPALLKGNIDQLIELG